MSKSRLWALVADAGRTRVFARDKPVDAFVEISAFADETELPKSQDIVSDRPGRTHESVGPSRHAMQAPTDPHRELKRQAARRVSDFLLERVRKDDFDSLIVVAPPTYLGDLRAALPQQVAERVAASFPKDMTKVPAHDLSQRLEELAEAAGVK